MPSFRVRRSRSQANRHTNVDTRLRQNGWWQRYANDPLSPAVARDVVSDVEAYLEEVGLRFAMPDDFVAVDRKSVV